MSDIEREAFEVEMVRIFDLPEEVLRKLPRQRALDEEGTEVYEGWEGEEAARTFSTAWLVWKAARARDVDPVTDEGIKNRLICATRQFRHNDDNSPDMLNPRDGFVIAYDKEEVKKLITDIRARPPAANQGVPEGWTVRRVEDRITVQHPKFGGYCASKDPIEDGSQIAPVILYHFAESMLTATKPQAARGWTKCSDHSPAIGQRVILKSRGVVQHYMPTLDQGDIDGFGGGGELFWDFEDATDGDYPSVDFENDEWMPAPDSTPPQPMEDA